MSLLDWCDDALEFGVVEIFDKGELGFFISFGVPDLVSLFTCVMESLVELELLVTFCWASLSCFRNLALLFWNQTWKKVGENDFSIIWFDCENLIKCECMSRRLAPWWYDVSPPLSPDSNETFQCATAKKKVDKIQFAQVHSNASKTEESRFIINDPLPGAFKSDGD
jgi:hypothetical protein